MRVIVAALFMLLAVVRGDECGRLCDSLAECKQHGKGSYCKTDKDPKVCQGLYWKDSAKTQLCDQRASGSSCPGDRPVSCSATTPASRPVAGAATTAAPAATTALRATTVAHAARSRIPDGRYQGAYGPVTFRTDVNSRAMTCDVSASVTIPFLGETVAVSARGLPFTMSTDGREVRLTDTRELREFRQGFPIALPDGPLVIRFDASKDRLYAPVNDKDSIEAVKH